MIVGRSWGHCGLAAEPGPREYAAVFRENDIDETVLPNLTAEDRKELGVTALGHRRKLLDAIAALRNDTSAPVPSSDLKRGITRTQPDRSRWARGRTRTIAAPLVEGQDR